MFLLILKRFNCNIFTDHINFEFCKYKLMINRLSLSLLFLILILTIGCKGQVFQYKTVPVTYRPAVNPAYNSEVQILQNSAADLTQYLPLDYVTDGSVDYTKQLQTGIDVNRVVLMPDFPVMISGVHLRNQSTVIFQKNSQILMAPSSLVWYQVLEINNVHDVNVFFANIKGERSQHIGTKGEWGFGIAIESSKNIRIINPVVSDCWGDGIYINNKSSPGQKINSEFNNIFIDGARLDNNRRNGISIIDGTNITIINSVISNTNGTMPTSGIDIEPNNGKGELKNITIDNVTTFNNGSFGIIVSLTSFVNEKQKDINLTIKNCTDDGSNYGMGYAFGRSKESDLIYAKGSIDVINPTWRNSRSRELWLPFYASKNTIKLNIHNPRVYKKGELTTSALKPVILSNSKNININ